MALLQRGLCGLLLAQTLIRPSVQGLIPLVRRLYNVYRSGERLAVNDQPVPVDTIHACATGKLLYV